MQKKYCYIGAGVLAGMAVIALGAGSLIGCVCLGFSACIVGFVWPKI